ncbi:hypothetical protein [Saccharothrix sp.]|uniref:hypothetical protein n=1 Tax=Saccharothrix sp. TaxID=1873460 RepID=UPI002811FDCD|nr:hypothetical protein [Saccharothrix sp.]
MTHSILRGAAAGAAGTTALNAVTFLDMLVRGRPASRTPEDSVRRMSRKAGVDIPGTPRQRKARVSGLGSLLGAVTGVSVGAAYGALRGLGWRPGALTATLATTVGAMAAAGVPMSALGVSDPRSWSVGDWLSDVLPHLAYGVVTVATYAATDHGGPHDA